MVSTIRRTGILWMAAAALALSLCSFAQSDPNVEKAKNFISLLNKGEYQAAFTKLDSNLGFQLKSGDRLSGVWKNLTGKAGSFVEFREAKVESVKTDILTYSVVTQVCKFEKGLVDIKVAFDTMGRVADFHYVNHETPKG